MKRTVIFGVILLLIIAGGLYFLNWVGNPSRPLANYLALAKADTAVSINDKGGYIEIIPATTNGQIRKGIIVYPGGLVTSESYIYPWVQVSKLTDSGIFIAKMPLNLAIFNVNASDKIIADKSEIQTWIISGHSSGGAMISEYLKAGRNLPKIKAIILMAAFPNDDFLKSNKTLKILSIRGSEDGKISANKFNEEMSKLPATVQKVEIPGMNHAQFGAYGKQSGDLTPKISDEDAWAEWVSIVVNFVDMIK